MLRRPVAGGRAGARFAVDVTWNLEASTGIEPVYTDLQSLVFHGKHIGFL